MKPSQISQLVSILLLLFMILGGLLFVMPMRDNVSALNTQVDAASVELQDLQSQYDKLAAISSKVDESTGAKAELLNAVPVGPAEDKLLDGIVAMADEFDLAMNSISFSKSTDNNFGNVLTVSANFKGSYDQLISFLQKIESSNRILRVSNLSVQLTSTEDAIFNLSIESYYQ